MKKILVIDDRQGNLTTIKAVIKNNMSDCLVLTALSGKEGIKIARKKQPDVILLDIIMPKMDGFETCDRLKKDELTKHIPVVMVTAIKTDTESRIKGLNLGADAFLSKPIDAVELSAQVNVMLRIKEAEDKLRAEKGILEETVLERTNKLKESEEKYKALYENAPLPYQSLNEDGSFLDVNPAWLDTLGYSREEVIGNFYKDFLHPDWKPHFEKNFPEFKRRGYVNNVHFKIKHKNGHFLDISFEGCIGYKPDGSFKQTYCVFKDITEQKMAEQALKESELQLKESQQIVALGSYNLDIQNGVWKSSSILDEIFGITNKYNKDVSAWLAIVHPDDRNMMQEYIAINIMTNHEAFNKEYRIMRIDNKEERWVHGHGKLQFTEKGELCNMIGTIQDITNRKRIEIAFQDSEIRFKDLVELLPEAVIETDSKLNITYINKKACEISGYTQKDIEKGLKWLDFLMPEDKVKALELFNKRKQGLSLGSIQYRAQKKDGSIFHVLFHANSILKDGEFVGIRAILIDITDQKKAEDELRETKNRYESLFNQIADPIIVFDQKSKNILHCNSVMIDKYGYTLDELKEMTPLSLHPDSDNLEIAIKNLNDDKQTAPNEYLHQAKDGSIFNVETHTQEIVFNKQIAWITIIRDITKRKRAEKASLESAEKYKVLYTSTNESIFLMLDYKFISCNPRTLTMYGCTEDEIIGHTPDEFSPKNQPDGKPSFKMAVKKIDAALSGKPQTFEWLHLKKDGSPFNAEVTLTKMVLSDGEYVHAIVRDITERKKAENVQKVLYNISNAVISCESLENLIITIQSQLMTIIDTQSYYVAIYDKENDYFSLPFIADKYDDVENFPAKMSLTGHVLKTKKPLLANASQQEKMVKKGIVNFVGPRSKIWLGVPLIIEKEVIGVLAVQSYTDENAYDEKDKKLLAFIADQISISIGRKKAEDELKTALKKATESDRLKSTFLATMSHELRTPLNAIIGFSDFIDENLPIDEIVTFSKTINDSGNHLLNIVEDLFDITLIESGQMKIIKEDIQLIPILENVHEIITAEKGKTGKENIELRLQIPLNMNDLTINTDRSKLKQVLINLLKNAVKFTNEGEVNYGFEEEIIDGKSFLKFFVTDTGIGIREDQQEIIFDVFRQVDETYTTVHGGTGIGLSITKKLTELMGGTIWVKSEVGKGSTFYFTIPNKRTIMLETDISRKNEYKKPLKTKTILIAEDIEASYQLIKAMLIKLDLNIIWAKDGEEAIKLCKENPQLDLVLMDINMPVMNGYDATKIIKKARPELPIIAQTAYAIIGDREKSIEAGCDDYISKPISKMKLIELVTKYLK